MSPTKFHGLLLPHAATCWHMLPHAACRAWYSASTPGEAGVLRACTVAVQQHDGRQEHGLVELMDRADLQALCKKGSRGFKDLQG